MIVIVVVVVVAGGGRVAWQIGRALYAEGDASFAKTPLICCRRAFLSALLLLPLIAPEELFIAPLVILKFSPCHSAFEKWPQDVKDNYTCDVDECNFASAMCPVP